MLQATYKEVMRKFCLHLSSQVGEIEDMVEWPTDSRNIYKFPTEQKAFSNLERIYLFLSRILELGKLNKSAPLSYVSYVWSKAL